MGGDHKCPVCQATFTRPQHVARHMRSHTGDRPYKCQHCGDQFARSDLLSRHVNKCHANEKPVSATAANNGRRKGSAAATRATTSKQACDQCVQASLPCDGCNPCAKCVTRKCRCTFVKFHRQTAPVGPGHNPNPHPTAGAARMAALPNSSVNPGPYSRPGSSKHDDLMYTQQAYSGMPSSYPMYAQSQSQGWNGYHTQDYTAYRRSSLDLDDYDSLSSRGGSSAASSNVHLPLDMDVGGVSVPGLDLDVSSIPQMNYRPPPGTSSSLPSNHHDMHRPGQEQQYVGHGSNPYNQEQFDLGLGLMSLDDPNVLAGLATDGQPFFSSPQQRPSTSGGYSSPDGYLERPNTSSGYDYSQPRPSTSGGYVTSPGGTRENETKELKEFWKQYMRTPLSGGGANSISFTPTPSASQHHQFDLTMPPMGGRRQRVSSLPSVKTPTAGLDSFLPANGHQQPHRNTRPSGIGMIGNMAALEDLKSYEQAVLARKAPSLNMDAAVMARKTKGLVRSSSQKQPPSQQDPRYPVAHPGHQVSVHHFEPSSIPRYDGQDPSSRESSASIDSGSSGSNGGGGGGGGLVASRPNFKRLASQVLEPSETKYAKHTGMEPPLALHDDRIENVYAQ